ncbi:MAG: hypothetical protein EVJ46_06340 [Candidatus Acididesulfobacter guangdongensis]|jgi:hypothetical protein|uniref:Uncharacterized protein n=1 Tax=Acididesulfobacter guangdongensis TaxID=2597225 RepID=A0A519BH73_ACIG2|nr:MAG: hypothetical protein EVJ46_06340 [Candidatus Acididesulfobacter guangdongensis]
MTKKKKKKKLEPVSPALNFVKLLFSFIGWLLIFAAAGGLLFLAVKHAFAASYKNGVCTFSRPLGYRYYNRRTGQGYDPYYSAFVNKNIFNEYFSGNASNMNLDNVNVISNNGIFVYKNTMTAGGYSAVYDYVWENNSWEYTEDLDIAQASSLNIQYMIPDELGFGPIIPIWNNKDYYEWWINNALNYYQTQQPAWFSYNSQIAEGFDAWECERAFRGYPITQITYTNREGRVYTRSLLTDKFPKIQPSSAGSCPPLPISELFGFAWCVKHGL